MKTTDDGRHRPARVWRGVHRHAATGQILAALLLILGAKLTLIGTVANPVPFWDQWFAEGERLYLPYLDGRLNLAALIAAHNEHRIFFTRLLLLAVLEFCGDWNTPAAMIAGAFVHLAAIASLMWCLRHSVRSAPLLPTAMLIIVFALPFGGENTLWGFESANYFVLLFGIWSVALTATSPAWTPRWLTGYAVGIVAILAMAAAGTALAASGAITAVQLLVKARPRCPREITAMLLLIGTGALLLAITPHPPGYLDGRAPSLIGFAWSLGLAGGWPVTIPAIGPILVHLPALCLMWLLWRGRVAAGADDWRIVALAGWVALQAAGTAYTRYPGPIASRYLDTFALACVINAVALVAMLRRWPDPTQLGWMEAARMRTAGAAWIAGILACLTFQATYFFPRAYFLDPRVRDAQIVNVDAYLTTGRFGHAGPQPYSSTYDDLPRLAQVLDRPQIRGLLPAELGSTASERRAVRTTLWLRGGLDVEWHQASRVAMLAGLVLLVSGSWLYAFLGLIRFPAPPFPIAPSTVRCLSEQEA